MPAVFQDTPLQIATYPTEQWKEDLENFTNMFKILASADLDVKVGRAPALAIITISIIVVVIVIVIRTS